MAKRQKTKRSNRAILMAVAMPVAGLLGAGAKSALAATDTWNVGNGNWDTTASNWSLGTYTNGVNVSFGTGSGTSGTALVNVDLGAVSPANFTINNSAVAYTFTGSAITATGTGTIDTAVTVDNSLTINGAVTFLAPTTSTASTGALNIGSGGSVTFSQASGTITQSENSTYNGNLIIAGADRLNFNSGPVFKNTPPAGDANGNTVTSGTGQIQLQMAGTAITNQSSALAGTVNVPINLNSLGTTNIPLDVTQAIGGSGSNGGSAATGVGTNGTGTYAIAIGATSSHDSAVPANLVMGGAISGNSDVEFAGNTLVGGGSGNLTLNAQNTWMGTTEIDLGTGTIFLGVNNALPINTDVVYGTNAGPGGDINYLDLNGHNQQVGSLSTPNLFGTNTTPTLFTILNNGTSNSTLTVGGTKATFYSFGSTIQDGTNGATLALVKQNTGTLWLSGNNTFSGGTTVNGGVLQVDGSLLSTGAVNVGGSSAANAPTLTGIGSVGNVTVNGANGGAAGTLAAGDNGTVGTLTASALTLQSGSILNVAFGASGTSNSLIDVLNNAGLTVSGGGVNLYQTGGTTPFAQLGTYDLLEYAGNYAGSPTNLTILDPQGGFNYSFGTNSANGNTYVDVVVSSVPEPTSAFSLLLLGGVAGLLRRRRKIAKA